ncbi:MAG: hypothetical protein H7062_16045 [Candidatus Saccharimonas sp.]|nr:hypothetical protein [Planctomycetaceae bacterium]
MARSLNLDQLTLRDKIREAARRSHDMIEHLEHAFVPKAHDLRKVSRPHDPKSEAPPIADVTIRHHAAMVLESDQYTEGLNAEAEALFEAIAVEVDKLATHGQPR